MMNNEELLRNLIDNWSRPNEDKFIDKLMKLANVNVEDEFDDRSDDAIALINNICEEVQVIVQAKKQLDLSDDNELFDVEETIERHESKVSKLFTKFFNDYVS